MVSLQLLRPNTLRVTEIDVYNHTQLRATTEGYDGNIRVDKGIPVGRGATIELRNQHLVYAGTWFSLSAATTAMFALLLRRRRLR